MGPTYVFFLYKDTHYRKFPVVYFIKTPHVSAEVRTVPYRCTYMHTYNTSVHMQCEAIYDDTGVRDANFMFSKVQVSKVYTCSYSLAKSMMSLFLWLYKFTYMPFGYVCVHRCRAQKLLHVYVCLLCVWHGLGITCIPALRIK